MIILNNVKSHNSSFRTPEMSPEKNMRPLDIFESNDTEVYQVSTTQSPNNKETPLLKPNVRIEKVKIQVNWM